MWIRSKTRVGVLVLTVTIFTGLEVIVLTGCSTKTQQSPRSGPIGIPADCPWLNSHLAIAKRVAMITRKMTLAEEIGLVEGHGMTPDVGDIQEN